MNLKKGDYVDIHMSPIGEYIGTVESVTPTSVVIQTEQGPTVTLNTNDISGTQKISHPSTYASIGLLLGTPAGFNFYGALTMNKLRVELFGSGGSGSSGIEGRVGYVFTNWKNFQQGAMLGAGAANLTVTTTVTVNGSSSSSTSTYLWNYLSASYFLCIYGFYADLGLSVGQGNVTSPQVVGDLGYIINFN